MTQAQLAKLYTVSCDNYNITDFFVIKVIILETKETSTSKIIASNIKHKWNIKTYDFAA